MRLPFAKRRELRPALAAEPLALTWQLISVLLDYPTAELFARLPGLRHEAARLPEPLAASLTEFCDGLAAHGLLPAQEAYVATFDSTRRCCLYLSYFEHGDTRKRGLALVEFKRVYREAGVDFTADELPDHLCVLLEFGACVAPEAAYRLFCEHRAGIEVLRQALQQRDSRYVHLIEALSATLPPLAGDEEQRLRKLIEEGPPREDVGMDLTPYLIDPQINAAHLPRARPSGPVPVTLGARP